MLAISSPQVEKNFSQAKEIEWKENNDHQSTFGVNRVLIDVAWTFSWKIVSNKGENQIAKVATKVILKFIILWMNEGKNIFNLILQWCFKESCQEQDERVIKKAWHLDFKGKPILNLLNLSSGFESKTY